MTKMPTRLLLSLVIITTVTAQTRFDNSTCGTVKGCVWSTPGCDPASSCAKAFSWKVDGPYLSMELAGAAISPVGPISYLAVGFSSDTTMGNEPVTDCTFATSGTATHLSYNSGKSNQRITNYTAMSDLQLLDSSSSNGRLYCAFRQRIQPSQSSNQVLPLNGNFYILLAAGTANDQGLNQHSMTIGSLDYPSVSSNTANLTAAMTVTAQVPFDNSTCLKDKGCMWSPPGCDPAKDCMRAFSWKVDGEYLYMELAGTSSGGTTNYIAVGFSLDTAMGNEPVTDCTFGPQGPAVHLSFNTAPNQYQNQNQRVFDYANMTTDLQLMNSTVNNGRVYCAIRQRISPSQNHSQVLSLNRTVYIFLATGVAIDPGLTQHDLYPGPFISNGTVNLSDMTAFSGHPNVCCSAPSLRTLIHWSIPFLLVISCKSLLFT